MDESGDNYLQILLHPILNKPNQRVSVQLFPKQKEFGICPLTKELIRIDPPSENVTIQIFYDQ